MGNMTALHQVWICAHYLLVKDCFHGGLSTHSKINNSKMWRKIDDSADIDISN